MMLPFFEGLMCTSKADPECAALADKHYSRGTSGSAQFMPPGETLILRNNEGTVVFGWHRALVPRADKQTGICCTIFRNESNRLSSDIIYEAEMYAIRKWGMERAFTYVAPNKIKSANPGCCFKKAGWKRVGKSKSGLILLEKFLHGTPS